MLRRVLRRGPFAFCRCAWSPHRVLRDGNETTIPSAEVVPGDIVSIKTGDTVPADLRLFEVMNLECDEAILTGEALPVAKAVEFYKSWLWREAYLRDPDGNKICLYYAGENGLRPETC